MALEQKLSLKLSQKLVMTPSLQQAIKLLQMTRMELETLLTQELVENPVLEEIEGDHRGRGAPARKSRRRLPRRRPTATGSTTRSRWRTSTSTPTSATTGRAPGASSMMEEREEPPIENSLSREPDLYDHLLWQLHMAESAPASARSSS